MKTDAWSEFIKEVLPDKSDRDFLKRSFGQLMHGVVSKPSHLSRDLGEPKE